MANVPVYVLESNPDGVPCDILRDEGVSVVPFEMPGSIGDYLFAGKVCASAAAEEIASGQSDTLVWLSSDCLVVNPPVLYSTGQDFDAAVRPVHIQNVGSPVAQPVDSFWRGIYDAVGIEDAPFSVVSFVDEKSVRAYFNSAAYSVNPNLGLLRRWRDLFSTLVEDEDFQMSSCQDELHRVFLHQAILSALLTDGVDERRLRILPPEYGYPYNLHSSVPSVKRAGSMNSLVSVIYEERSIHPSLVKDIEIDEPLNSWLNLHAGHSLAP